MSVMATPHPIVLPKYGGKTVFHFGGALGLIEYLAPVGAGTPPHIHHLEDEAFYVLAGELTVWADGIERKGGLGGFEGALDKYAAMEAQLCEEEAADLAAVAATFASYGLEPVNF